MAKTERPQRSEPLQAAWRALDAGDVAAARRLAGAVVLNPPSPAVQTEAQELLQRTAVPWSVLLFGAFAAVLLLLLVLLAMFRSAHL
jgi:hypothetical protein